MRAVSSPGVLEPAAPQSPPIGMTQTARAMVPPTLGTTVKRTDRSSATSSSAPAYSTAACPRSARGDDMAPILGAPPRPVNGPVGSTWSWDRPSGRLQRDVEDRARRLRAAGPGAARGRATRGRRSGAGRGARSRPRRRRRRPAARRARPARRRTRRPRRARARRRSRTASRRRPRAGRPRPPPSCAPRRARPAGRAGPRRRRTRSAAAPSGRRRRRGRATRAPPRAPARASRTASRTRSIRAAASCTRSTPASRESVACGERAHVAQHLAERVRVERDDLRRAGPSRRRSRARRRRTRRTRRTAPA